MNMSNTPYWTNRVVRYVRRAIVSIEIPLFLKISAGVLLALYVKDMF